MRPLEEIDVQGKKLNFNCYLDVHCMVVSKIEVLRLGAELAIGRGGPGQQWAGSKPGWAKIGPVFSGQNFNSSARPKNRAGRAK